MKKSILALAVATASLASVAQADSTTLYGSIRVAYTYSDLDGDDNDLSKFDDAGSRFGIKGSDDLGNGLTAFYKYENRIKSTATTKKLYAGVKGSFGSVSFGKQDLPVDMVGEYNDPFNSLTPSGGNKSHAETSSANSVVYTSPEMSGLQFGIGLVADGDANYIKPVKDEEGNVISSDGRNGSNHIDHINAAIVYNANGIHAGLGYSTSNGFEDAAGKEIDEEDTITVALGYGNDQFEVGVEADFYEMSNDDDAISARLGALYKVTPNDSVYIGFASTDSDASDFGEDWGAAIGYQHKLSKRSRVWAEYNFEDDDKAPSSLVIGLRTDF